jgi:hypothetical protein
VADQTAVQGTTAERRNGLAQAVEDIVEGQQGAAPELDDNRLLGLGQGRAARPGGAHWCVRGRGAPPPLGDRLWVQPVPGGQGTGRRLRRLVERMRSTGSNSRRRAG